jgi:tRNA(fMet)-specific endonuclease VapC
MVMAKFLLDTNHLSHAIRRVSPLRDRLRQAVREGHQLGTCWPVLCELEVGIRQTELPDAVRKTLHTVLTDVRIWPFDWQLVQIYGEFRHLTKSQGIAFSHVDLVLASMARCMDATLLTTDNDFDAIPSIRTENWTTLP